MSILIGILIIVSVCVGFGLWMVREKKRDRIKAEREKEMYAILNRNLAFVTRVKAGLPPDWSLYNVADRLERDTANFIMNKKQTK